MENLNEIENLINQGKHIFEKKEKSSIIVIGDTGEGKSTVVNYLAGFKL